MKFFCANLCESRGRFLAVVLFVCLSLMLATNLAVASLEATTNAPPVEPEPKPESPREFFNAGTRKLRDGKLQEAETFLQSALASQNAQIRPPALYNLGHVRFNQGSAELKKSQSAPKAVAQGRRAMERSAQAVKQAEDALAQREIQAMIAAYQNGRGARREMKEAIKAVERALELHGAALRKWQRALGDFKSALELNPHDDDARTNAEITERAIAKLIDSIRELQQVSMGMSGMKQDLGEIMQQLRGQIPGELMPPGGEGDEEEEEGQPRNPDGQEEGPSRDGKEMTLSPEEAAWILEGFKLGGERRLPMSQGQKGEPKSKKGKTW